MEISKNTEEAARTALRDGGHEVTEGGFLEAARRGDAAALELYLAAGFDARRAAMITGRSLLVEAAKSGSAEAVERLLACGGDPAERDREGKTALHAAAEAGQKEALKKLLGARPDLETLDDQGRSALFSALVTGQGETAGILLQAGASPWTTDPSGLTAVEWTVRYGSASIIHDLASHGLDIHQHLPSGHTLLTAAAAAGQAEVVRTLLDRKADPRILSADGRTALQHAIAGGHAEIAHLLKKAMQAVPREPKGAAAKARPEARYVEPRRRPKAERPQRQEGSFGGSFGVRPALLRALVGVALLGVVVWLVGRTLPAPSDPALFPPPQEAARATLTFAQEEIEAFRQRFGRLPKDMRELGLEGTGEYRYLPYADQKNYRLEVTVAGWTESVDTGGG